MDFINNVILKQNRTYAYSCVTLRFPYHMVWILKIDEPWTEWTAAFDFFLRDDNACMFSSGGLVISQELRNLCLGSGPSCLSRGDGGQLLRALPGYSYPCIYNACSHRIFPIKIIIKNKSSAEKNILPSLVLNTKFLCLGLN